MEGLGMAGTTLLWVLVGTLVVGLGLFFWRVFGLSIFNSAPVEKKKQDTKTNSKYLVTKIEINYWFKLAMMSFIGIVLSSFALGLINIIESKASPHTRHSPPTPMTNGSSMATPIIDSLNQGDTSTPISNLTPNQQMQSLQRDLIELRMMLNELQR